ncbi:hypothetical protein [Cupriavidus sp. AU9028]|uniref:hypothetical protein n=1 Tax=Cupriavidus sp. AU9028 TaxID=2871157 RepID=UPI001C97C129|nr:hypothetical protein [Cupriavidus sp. AU9028]MBY4896061.1 hypothetical protein [Cupriavidus sp. AU9028]
MSTTNGLISTSPSQGSPTAMAFDAAVTAAPLPAPETTTGFSPGLSAASAVATDGEALRQPSTWWHAGVYCSAPAVFLWIVAHLPAEMVQHLFRGHAMPVVLNQLGDVLFVCGWAISGILLWGTRRRLRG